MADLLHLKGFCSQPDLKGENVGNGGLPGRKKKKIIEFKPIEKTILHFFFLPHSSFLLFWRQFFCNTVKGRKIFKLTKTATETSQYSEALGSLSRKWTWVTHK